MRQPTLCRYAWQLSAVAVIVCSCTLGTPSHAQTTGAPRLAGDTLDISKMRLVLPPAVVLVGASPNEIQRPGNPQQLAASLLSSAGSDGTIPDAVAFETSPYWVFKHRPVRTSEYYKASPINIYRNASFSFATKRDDSAAVAGAAGPRTSVAIGLRTLLKSAAIDSSVLAGLTNALTAVSEAEQDRADYDDLADSLVGATRRVDALSDSLDDALARHSIESDAARRDSLARAAKAFLQERTRLRGRILAYQHARDTLVIIERQSQAAIERARKAAAEARINESSATGFSMELAMGMRSTFPEGRWQGVRSDGIGVWVTPSYWYRPGRLALTTVARYLTRVREYDGQNLLDFGGRLDLVRGPLTLAGEYVNRSLIERDEATSTTDPRSRFAVENASRWTTTLQYRLAAGAMLVGSFGSDYKREGGRPVISTVGLHFGFGSVGLVADQPKK